MIFTVEKDELKVQQLVRESLLRSQSIFCSTTTEIIEKDPSSPRRSTKRTDSIFARGGGGEGCDWQVERTLPIFTIYDLEEEETTVVENPMMTTQTNSSSV